MGNTYGVVGVRFADGLVRFGLGATQAEQGEIIAQGRRPDKLADRRPDPAHQRRL